MNTEDTNQPRQAEPVNQQHAGVYRKFNVSRTDGRDQPGNDRHGAEYFVLDVTHDKFAKPALAAYVAACRDDYPALAADMVRRYGIAAQQQTERECGCGWRGPAGDCVRLGEVGPLCPECRETTEQAQQAEPATWKPGHRPPSVFKTSEAGRQFVADFFANALLRHDFSSYIKWHLAADFACALSDGLHAMQQAQLAERVPDDAFKDAERYKILRLGRYWSVIGAAGQELRGDHLDIAVDSIMRSSTLLSYQAVITYGQASNP